MTQSRSDRVVPAARHAARGSWLLGVCLGAMLLVSQAAPAQRSEALRVAYLYNFLKFVEWPAGSHATADSALRICASGEDDPVLGAIMVLQGREVGGRRLEVSVIPVGNSVQGCHVLYVATQRARDVSRLLELTSGQAILTVSDSEGFIRRGGMIGLVFLEGRLQFDVNLQAAQQVQLRLSSHLLRLARSVSRPGENN